MACALKRGLADGASSQVKWVHIVSSSAVHQALWLMHRSVGMDSAKWVRSSLPTRTSEPDDGCGSSLHGP